MMVYAAGEGRPAYRPLPLFEAFNRQLTQRGLVLKRGTILDATVVEAAVKPPCDAHSQPGEGSPHDPDAQWHTHKAANGKRTHAFGYKAHVAVDVGSGLMRKALLTGAKINETVVADGLISGDEQCIYADKAYGSAARRALLERLGIADGIMRRAWRGTAHAPDPQLVARNRVLAAIRFAVERSFATMKRWYGFRCVRYRGLGRNALQLYLLCSALNLHRALVLGTA